MTILGLIPVELVHILRQNKGLVGGRRIVVKLPAVSRGGNSASIPCLPEELLQLLTVVGTVVHETREDDTAEHWLDLWRHW